MKKTTDRSLLLRDNEKLIAEVAFRGHSIFLVEDLYAESPLAENEVKIWPWSAFNHLVGFFDYTHTLVNDYEDLLTLESARKRAESTPMSLRRAQYCRVMAKKGVRRAVIMMPYTLHAGIITPRLKTHPAKAHGIVTIPHSIAVVRRTPARVRIRHLEAILSKHNDWLAGSATGYRINTKPIIEQWGFNDPVKAVAHAKGILLKLIEKSHVQT